MKTVYFVTEGNTDKIVIEGLIAQWLGDQDFTARHIQPPESAYAEGLDTNLSQGWKGVLAWCAGRRPAGPAGQGYVLKNADCLVIHTDADVAADVGFYDPSYSGPCPPAKGACDWVRDRLTALFAGGVLPSNVVLCVPSKDLEAWVLCALHPDHADTNAPIECLDRPATLLAGLKPHRLVRYKSGELTKETGRYKTALETIVAGWENCAGGTTPRCPEAARFEQEARQVLGV